MPCALPPNTAMNSGPGSVLLPESHATPVPPYCRVAPAHLPTRPLRPAPQALGLLALKLLVLGPLQLACAAVCRLSAEAAMSLLLLALCPVVSTCTRAWHAALILFPENVATPGCWSKESARRMLAHLVCPVVGTCTCAWHDSLVVQSWLHKAGGGAGSAGPVQARLVPVAVALLDVSVMVIPRRHTLTPPLPSAPRCTLPPGEHLVRNCVAVRARGRHRHRRHHQRHRAAGPCGAHRPGAAQGHGAV